MVQKLYLNDRFLRSAEVQKLYTFIDIYHER